MLHEKLPQATSHHTPVAGSVMQPIASSVVQNIRVEQDYRKSDDRYIPADLVVVAVVVPFLEVPDLGSMADVVLVEPILHLPHHISPQPLDIGTAAEGVVAGLVRKEEEFKTEEGKDESEESDPVKEDKEVQMDEQPIVAGIKKKKDKKMKKRQEVPSKPTGPSINQPIWDELKNAPEDTRILQEMCEKNGKCKTPTPDMVRLTIKASEALLGTLPKKERDLGSPLITVTVGDVIIRNTLLDLGASVNVLSGYLYDKYKNEELEPAKTVLQLADQSTKVSWGKLTNVIVKVGDFFYPLDFLVMEYESLEDAPALILGRPFLATAGAVMDCKTGDLDISFGTRKRRLNMFGCPISLPSGYDDKYLNSIPLMAPGTTDKGKNQSQGNGRKEEEILRETKRHPLSTVDKVQLLDMLEMMELKHQQYEKDTQCREAKWYEASAGSHEGLWRIWKPRSGKEKATTRDRKMTFRRDHPFLRFPEVLDDTPQYEAQRDELSTGPVLAAVVLDRDILAQAGLWAELEPFIYRTWVDREHTFTCHG
ncbi:hypothetical protein L1887_28728 [Cichorium endivia]|nr:hypothetical protein L1887_28728 [Cichorium endivia]